MANLRICPVNHLDASDTLTATNEVAGMEVTNLQFTARNKFWRSSSTASMTLQGKWSGSSRILSAFGMFRHNCHPGTVRLYLFTSTSWTTQVYDSGALNVQPTVSAGAYDWGHDPGGSTATDPFKLSTDFSHYFSPVTAGSWRVVLAGTAPASYWQIGRIFLGTYFEATTNPDYGMTLGWVHDAARSRSRGGSLRTSGAGSTFRSLAFDLAYISEAQRSTWLDIMRTCGVERDVMVSVFPAVGERLERDYLINGKFAAQDHISYLLPEHRKRVVIEEL